MILSSRFRRPAPPPQMIDVDESGDLEKEEIVIAVKSNQKVIKFLVNCGEPNLQFLLVPARLALPVAEYSANLVKKSLVGNGHADKNQVQKMVGVLLPGAKPKTADAADALAIAICHAHHRRVPKIADKVLQRERA